MLRVVEVPLARASLIAMPRKLQTPFRKPIPRRRLVRWLRRHGWTHARTSGGHDVWTSPDGSFRMALPVRSGSTLIGQPFLRQINEYTAGVRMTSRGRRVSSHADDDAAPNGTSPG